MTLCTMPDCGQPAGTACTMSGCPGRSFKNLRAAFSPSPERGQPVGAGVTPDARPRIYPTNSHSPSHTQVQP